MVFQNYVNAFMGKNYLENVVTCSNDLYHSVLSRYFSLQLRFLNSECELPRCFCLVNDGSISGKMK